MILFKTFKNWKSYCLSGVCDLFEGLTRIFLSLILGIVSIAFAMWKSVNAFCRREFRASLIVAILVCIILLCWFITFAKERVARLHAEYERDSLSLVLSERVSYETDTTYYFNCHE